MHTTAPQTDRATELEAPRGYSFGVSALLLLYLDKRPAEWVPVAELCRYVGSNPNTVLFHLETLVGNNMVRVQRQGEYGPDQGEITEAQAALAQTH